MAINANETKNGHISTVCTTKEDILKRLNAINDSDVLQDVQGLPQTFVCSKEPINVGLELEDGNIKQVDLELAKTKKTDKTRILILVNVLVPFEGETFTVGVKASKKQVVALLNAVETNANLQIPVKFTRSAEKYDNEGNKVASDNPNGFWRFYGRCLFKVEGNTPTNNKTAAEQTVKA
jgi:hypothetical protein